ncbi:MAG: zinc-binding dehydrogenase [Ferrovibrio sp.]|uniref:zinc-binding dehydrogenase n=1 Tax=Ferrovibrio sp. TaxID=1917215 RepID=UPI002604F08A|nr:zinc-binding dehydrogenase [Ferrovibrio sp.]MCW0232655.1 zinc-binding dehydrogenase [Ferrovibrio sp.]
MSATYRAMLCRRLGPPDVLEPAELPRRALQPGEVRIAVHATGVNFPDLLQVAGDYQHRPPLPFVPGFEAAGEITELAGDVRNWQAGDAVLLRGTGAYAEEMVAPAATLLPKPADWSWDEAAAFPVAAATAWVALLWRGRLLRGETLLVLGAGGGTGLAAVALGAQAGARVVAVASSAEKREAALAAGATVALDPAIAGWEQGLQAEVVFDPVGGEMFSTAWRALKPGGRWLVVGFAGGGIPRPPANRLLLKEAELIGVRAGEQARRDPLAARALKTGLRDWLVGSEGRRPLIGAIYRLDEAAAALRRLADRNAVGKLVLRPR